MADSLAGKIAVVTGGSWGVGKGCALGLGEAGATVYITGRTSRIAKPDTPTSVEHVADEVTALGGKGIGIVCDHTDDAQVEAAFKQVLDTHGHIDILVNNVWGGYATMNENNEWTWMKPFWEQSTHRWHAMMDAGVRANFIASKLAAPSMVAQKSGLIVSISFWAAQKFMGNVIYGVAKAATDKLMIDMAHELRPHNVASVGLYPGLVRTEEVLKAAEQGIFDLANSESPQFQGRVIAALYNDPKLMEKSGRILITATEALEYGITDVDGKQPRPITIDEA